MSARVREPRHRIGDFVKRPHAADIRERNQKRGFLLHLSQEMHHLRVAGSRANARGGIFHQAREMMLWIFMQQRTEAGNILADKSP